MLKVLVIEDSMDHFMLIEDALTTNGLDGVTLHHEMELSVGLKVLEQSFYDICLCDLQLPDSPLESTIETLKHLNTTTPIIALTSLNSTGVAKELLQHGVQDYLPKEDLSSTLLNRMCIYAIERKRQQLMLEKQNADMQTFCASLSHDFKGHLRRISDTVEFLQEDLAAHIELNEAELKWFHRLEESALGIQDLVKGLGQFLSVDHTDEKMLDVDLSDVFQKLQELILYASEKNVQLVIEEGLPIVKGNVSQINILFHNLITNGIKYNDKDPYIQIKAQQNQATNFFEISIKDNGIGINEEHFEDIFTPFKRLHGVNKFAGSGLGLSIVKRIVERHQGEIRIESNINEGSTFTVSLPAAAV